MFKVENLSVSYYGNEVVSDISFEFETGRLIGIIGPNGAGKSTMIKAILDLIPKDRGKVSVDGASIDTMWDIYTEVHCVAKFQPRHLSTLTAAYFKRAKHLGIYRYKHSYTLLPS